MKALARNYLHRRNRGIVVAVDLALGVSSFVLAVFLLQDQRGSAWSREVLTFGFPCVLFSRLVGIFGARLEETSLRYPSYRDALRVIQGVLTGSILLFLCMRVVSGMRLPAAVFVLDSALLLCVWMSVHCGARLYDSARLYDTLRLAPRRKEKRAVVIGAGDAGASLVKELASDHATPSKPVALLDDDVTRQGRSIYGVPVMGGINDLEAVAQHCHANEVLICVPSATPQQMSRILAVCRQAKLPVRTLPTLAELIDGQVSQRALRQLNIRDLLNRDEISHEPEEIGKIVGGKVVLITGAGGSIGSELARQVASGSPSTLLLLDKSENSLFYIHRELREHYPDLILRPLLIDLACRHFVDEFMREEQPELIFHAAAHKHVGLIELHPHEGIRNNVLGIRNLALAALRCKASLFVNISSDKAVNPRNYMGCTKRITELLIQDLAKQQGATRFMNVRFGNVAGSTGSVLRLFWDQIQQGGPLLVTDPRATRYFMSIPEAVYLILRAAELGRGGETFVFEMGEPINIYELAKSMSLLAGRMPGRDISIHFVGLQRGEKVAEELWEEWENPGPTPIKEILVITDRNPASERVLDKIQKLEMYLTANDRDGLRDYVYRMVPQFARNRKEIQYDIESTAITTVVETGRTN
jgi:FlaA1/EpsC-like NDP-sugar epimerase